MSAGAWGAPAQFGGVSCFVLAGRPLGRTAAAQSTAAPGGSAAEPRVDPLLTVVYATRTATGVTQAIAGPFDLGRPQGCPKSGGNGKWRIPQEKEESPE